MGSIAANAAGLAKPLDFVARCRPSGRAPRARYSASPVMMTFFSSARVLRLGAAAAAALLLAACSTAPVAPTAPQSKRTNAPLFEAQTFSALPASEPTAWAPALSAFQRSCERIGQEKPWQAVCEKAKAALPEQAQEFFEANFTPWRVAMATYEGGEEVARSASGLMTGYYEPLLFGSRTRIGSFQHPIYGVPDDLLIIDLADLYPSLKGMRLRGKLEGRRVVPYDTRAEIQKRRDLSRWAIAWVDDPVAAFFLQIQGSGRILLPDGSFMRVGFADQNGYRYRSIGNWLVKHSTLKPHELSMQGIRAWAKKNPSRVKEALAQNPSFIFFEERTGDPALGPIGAQGVPLTPRASVAVDPKHWRLGTPFIASVSQKRPALAFTRPVIAQDTGGAIKGLIRLDYFWGFGDEAGEDAGRQKSELALWALIPNGFAPQDIRPGGQPAALAPRAKKPNI